MRILLTGGAGFIGSHVAERLVARGDELVIVDDFNDYYDPQVKRRNAAALQDHAAAEIIEGDIRDGACLDGAFARGPFDVVVHLAARAGVRPSLEDPELYEQVNCLGTLNILKRMRQHEIRRLVFASSSSVYGNSADAPFREDVVIDRPISPYAATKAAGELYAYTYHHLYGIAVNTLRFFTVYGPRQRPDMAIHKFTSLIDRGEPVPFFGDGTTARDYTYYADIVDGVVSAIDTDCGFEIFNLGESQTTTLAELIALIEQGLGKTATLKRLPMQPGDVALTYADISKAGRLLNYRPSTPIAAGVTAFIDWYRQLATAD